MVIWCDCHSHHAIEGEVAQCEVHEKQVPEKLLQSPFKPHHGINYDRICCGLHKDIR